MNDPVALAQQLAEVQARIADLTQQADTIKAAIVAATRPGDVIMVNGQAAYKVRQRRTFNSELARETLDPGIVAAISITRLDGAALKRLSPALWAACCVTSDPYVAAAGR